MKSNLLNEGFFSQESERFRTQARLEHHEWFEIADRLNRLSHAMLPTLSFAKGDVRALIVCSLFLRVMETFESIILVGEIGLQAQARMLARCQMEAMFTLAAVHADEDTAKKLAAADAIFRKKSINKVLELDMPVSDEEREKMNTLLKELNDLIRENEITEMKAWKLAEIAGLEGWYKTVYSLLCHAVHSNIRDLEEYVVPEDDALSRLIGGPKFDKLTDTLYVAFSTLILALMVATNYSNGDFDEEIREVDHSVRQLIESR